MRIKKTDNILLLRREGLKNNKAWRVKEALWLGARDRTTLSLFWVPRQINDRVPLCFTHTDENIRQSIWFNKRTTLIQAEINLPVEI